MVEYFDVNQHAFWFALGFLLLAVEALVFGFATGVVLFSGIGALITGGLMWSGWLPSTWLAGIATFGLGSFLSALLLWKPLMKMQRGNENHKDRSSDFIGHEFRLENLITTSAPGKTRYSGVEWRVEIDDSAGVEPINTGEKVVVTSIDAGVFYVSRKE